MTDVCREILRFLNCKYEIFENESDSNAIMNRYLELREEGKREGFTPLVVIPDRVLAETLGFIYDDYGVEESQKGIKEFREKALEEAAVIDGKTLLQEKMNQILEDWEKEELDNEIMGNFSYAEPMTEFNSYIDYSTDKPREEIVIVKIPTENPWEVAVWMPMGGFNDCPMPSEQVAVFKYWYEKYGAVPAVVGYDTWELYTDKTLKENNELEELAVEQYSFCYDIVDQGCETIRNLASGLRNSHIWYFWWD